jgi:hypothetical protein
MMPLSFPVRNRGGKSERTTAYFDVRDFGHAISRLPQNILIAFWKRRQIAIFEETHRSQGKAGVPAVHFGKSTQCLLERNTRRKYCRDVSAILRADRWKTGLVLIVTLALAIRLEASPPFQTISSNRQAPLDTGGPCRTQRTRMSECHSRRVRG